MGFKSCSKIKRLSAAEISFLYGVTGHWLGIIVWRLRGAHLEKQKARQRFD